jgi:hypothetical protein
VCRTDSTVHTSRQTCTPTTARTSSPHTP